jgi:hypothetical protein
MISLLSIMLEDAGWHVSELTEEQTATCLELIDLLGEDTFIKVDRVHGPEYKTNWVSFYWDNSRQRRVLMDVYQSGRVCLDVWVLDDTGTLRCTCRTKDVPLSEVKDDFVNAVRAFLEEQA